MVGTRFLCLYVIIILKITAKCLTRHWRWGVEATRRRETPPDWTELSSIFHFSSCFPMVNAYNSLHFTDYNGFQRSMKNRLEKITAKNITVLGSTIHFHCISDSSLRGPIISLDCGTVYLLVDSLVSDQNGVQ